MCLLLRVSLTVPKNHRQLAVAEAPHSGFPNVEAAGTSTEDAACGWLGIGCASELSGASSVSRRAASLVSDLLLWVGHKCAPWMDAVFPKEEECVAAEQLPSGGGRVLGAALPYGRLNLFPKLAMRMMRLNLGVKSKRRGKRPRSIFKKGDL